MEHTGSLHKTIKEGVQCAYLVQQINMEKYSKQLLLLVELVVRTFAASNCRLIPVSCDQSMREVASTAFITSITAGLSMKTSLNERLEQRFCLLLQAAL